MHWHTVKDLQYSKKADALMFLNGSQTTLESKIIVYNSEAK